MSHSALTWQINDKEFAYTNLSKMSKNLEKGVITWLDGHTDSQRKKVINNIFSAIEETGIEKLSSMIKLKNIMRIVNSLKSIDQESKDLALDFIKFNTNFIKENRAAE